MRYYVNNKKDEHGDNEVHNEDCFLIPVIVDKTFLGFFNNCREAVSKAKETKPYANGCKHCSPDCHTR